MGMIEQAKAAIGGGLYYYREAGKWNVYGADSLRQGQNALAGSHYAAAAAEFTHATALFNHGASEGKLAHDALEIALKGLQNTEILTWSQGTTETMQGYATAAQQLSTESASIANLPPQAAAIAAERAATCMGGAGAIIEAAQESTVKLYLMVQGIEDLRYSI